MAKKEKHKFERVEQYRVLQRRLDQIEEDLEASLEKADGQNESTIAVGEWLVKKRDILKEMEKLERTIISNPQVTGNTNDTDTSEYAALRAAQGRV